MKILLLLTSLAVATLTGCVSSAENPNLRSAISDPTKAEITGSKNPADAPMPDRISVTRIDDRLLRQFALDTTIRIWPVAPGSHELEVNYLGGVGKILPRTFGVTTKIRADFRAGVRYILKAHLNGETVTFWVEEVGTGTRIAESKPLLREFFKIYIPVPTL